MFGENLSYFRKFHVDTLAECDAFSTIRVGIFGAFLCEFRVNYINALSVAVSGNFNPTYGDPTFLSVHREKE
jgi:hypothetical protein